MKFNEYAEKVNSYLKKFTLKGKYIVFIIT